LKNLAIQGYKIRLNSLGCPADKAKLSSSVAQCLKNKAKQLCADCRIRLKNNPLRILDCKIESCKEAIKGMGLKEANLCPDCADHYAKVRSGLDDLKIGYVIDPLLVRGLDYYTQTIFEIAHPELGAQDALGAGGRYNNLVKELGGPDVGAIGFAFGAERLLLVSSIKYPVSSKEQLTYVITLGDEARGEGIKLLSQLRKNGIAADADYEGKSLKGAMRRASDLQAKFVLIIGEDEIKKGIVTLKNMDSGEQREVSAADLPEALKVK
jgi:histidyl-tRNA synthetase